jgi:hypothetical protein
LIVSLIVRERDSAGWFGLIDLELRGFDDKCWFGFDEDGCLVASLCFAECTQAVR